MWSVRTVGVTGAEPVTLAEAKAQCRVDHTDDDTLITRLTKVAREMIEARTGVLTRAQTIEITYQGFSDPFCLPRAPISAVTSLTYGDVEIEDFRFGAVLSVPLLRPALLARWPVTLENVVILATGGYADGEVPERLRHAMLIQTADWYANRESGELSETVEDLICDFRLTWL